jgi:hypothetical protein
MAALRGFPVVPECAAEQLLDEARLCSSSLPVQRTRSSGSDSRRTADRLPIGPIVADKWAGEGRGSVPICTRASVSLFCSLAQRRGDQAAVISAQLLFRNATDQFV